MSSSSARAWPLNAVWTKARISSARLAVPATGRRLRKFGALRAFGTGDGGRGDTDVHAPRVFRSGALLGARAPGGGRAVLHARERHPRTRAAGRRPAGRGA